MRIEITRDRIVVTDIGPEDELSAFVGANGGGLGIGPDDEDDDDDNETGPVCYDWDNFRQN